MWRLIIFIDRNAAGMLQPPQVWHRSAHARCRPARPGVFSSTKRLWCEHSLLHCGESTATKADVAAGEDRLAGMCLLWFDSLLGNAQRLFWATRLAVTLSTSLHKHLLHHDYSQLLLHIYTKSGKLFKRVNWSGLSLLFCPVVFLPLLSRFKWLLLSSLSLKPQS